MFVYVEFAANQLHFSVCPCNEQRACQFQHRRWRKDPDKLSEGDYQLQVWKLFCLEPILGFLHPALLYVMHCIEQCRPSDCGYKQYYLCSAKRNFYSKVKCCHVFRIVSYVHKCHPKVRTYWKNVFQAFARDGWNLRDESVQGGFRFCVSRFRQRHAACQVIFGRTFLLQNFACLCLAFCMFHGIWPWSTEFFCRSGFIGYGLARYKSGLDFHNRKFYSLHFQNQASQHLTGLRATRLLDNFSRRLTWSKYRESGHWAAGQIFAVLGSQSTIVLVFEEPKSHGSC